MLKNITILAEGNTFNLNYYILKGFLLVETKHLPPPHCDYVYELITISFYSSAD